MSSKTMRVTSVLLLACATCVLGRSKILVVFPLPGKSHSIAGHSVVDILLDAGHEVTYVTPFPKKNNHPRLKYVDVSSLVEDVAVTEARHFLNMAYLARNPRPIHAVRHLGPALTKRGLLHPAVQELMQDTTATFDLVIAEWFYSGLLAPLSTVFECPLVWYSAADVCGEALSYVHEGASAAYTVEQQVRDLPSVPFTLAQRAHQLWLQIYLSSWSFYVKHTFEIPSYHEIYYESLKLRSRRLPDYDEVVYNGSMFLINSHPPLGQNIPLPPNVQYVGGHHVEVPTKPLPQNLQIVLDNAKHGAIFFSMGSNVKSKDFPDDMKRELVELFGQLEQTVLWKFEEKIDNLPRNVHILDWAPQTSILNHTNTKLFISHGGLLSQIEATLFGVPVVGIPLFGDQFVNVELAAARGCALRVYFTDSLPQDIMRAVNTILADYSSYQANAKQASELFQRRLSTPQRALAHWTQLVLYTRGANHLSSPAVRVRTADRLYLDLVALLVLFLFFLSKVVKVIRVHRRTHNEDLDKKNQ